MVKKSKSAVEIAEENRPGWKAVKPSGPIKQFGAPERDLADAVTKTQSVDAVMPATRKLRAKFFGNEATDAADEANYHSARPLEPDTELVDLKSGDIERTVAVNTTTGKLDWSQG
jgi:hypothetical protein